jgi:hypothetical protein
LGTEEYSPPVPLGPKLTKGISIKVSVRCNHFKFLLSTTINEANQRKDTLQLMRIRDNEEIME